MTDHDPAPADPGPAPAHAPTAPAPTGRLTVSHVHTAGLGSLAWALHRLGENTYYDFARRTFNPLPAPVGASLPALPVAPLPEVSPGNYVAVFTDPIPDGDYRVVYLSTAGPGAVALTHGEAVVRNGSDATVVPLAALPNTATVTVGGVPIGLDWGK
jgi:hypothetical protein